MIEAIVFKHIDHVRDTCIGYIEQLNINPHTKKIAAALISYWKWKQQREPHYLGVGPDCCALCSLHDKYDRYGGEVLCDCGSCVLAKIDKECDKKTSAWNIATSYPNRSKQPLVDALFICVLHEFVDAFANQCADSVKEMLK